MAKVRELILCPKCGIEMDKKDDFCVCGFRFLSPVSEYRRPDYIYFQKHVVKADPNNWFKTCPHESQIAAMEDALKTVKFLLQSRPPHEGHLARITGIGKQIGRISQAIEDYSKVGGHIEFTEPTTAKTNDETTLENY
jgi:hypothetical protein